jgi:hypothetical protein
MRLPEPTAIRLFGLGLAVTACVVGFRWRGFSRQKISKPSLKELTVLWTGESGLRCRLHRGVGYYKLTLTKFGREIRSAAFYREMQARDVARAWQRALLPGLPAPRPLLG